MFGGELAVVVLSAVPLVENRGAMFIGFALGITNPLIYMAGTAVNVLSMPLWSLIFRKIPLPIPSIKAKPLQDIPLLVALPYTGVNMGTVLCFFPKLFKAQESEIYPYLAAGILFRGALTYLFLIGLAAFMPPQMAIALLVLWYVVSRIAKRLIWRK